MQEKLQRELDEALGAADDAVTTFDQVKRLPYLDAVGSTPPLRLGFLAWLLRVV